MPEGRPDRSPPATPARGGRWPKAIALSVVLAAPCASWAGPPDQVALDLSLQLTALSDRLSQPSSAGVPAALLVAQSGLANAAAFPSGAIQPVPDAPASAVPPEGRRMDLRLGLTMLSQAYGQEDNGAVTAAQSDPQLPALVLTQGRAGLSDLARIAAASGLPFASSGGTLTLHVPLVVWPGAGLDLGPGDELRLSRPDGAFILNFGSLTATGAAILSDGAANARIPRFAPFLTTAGSGTIRLDGARIEGLGFGTTVKFSGVAVLRDLVSHPGPPAHLVESSFKDLVSLNVSGDEGVVIRGNRFRDMRGAALVVHGSTAATIASNLFSGAMPTNAIRVESGSQGVTVGGNVILGGERAGIVVRNDSVGYDLVGNVVWAREGSGIVVNGADCGRIRGNLVLGNQQKGIELRDSVGGAVTGNRVLSNENAALWISDQSPGTLTVVAGNQIAFNGAGLSAAQGESILLDGNDLSGQYLQFVSGDLVPQAAHLARDMRGSVPMVLSTAGRSDPPAAIPACED